MPNRQLSPRRPPRGYRLPALAAALLLLAACAHENPTFVSDNLADAAAAISLAQASGAAEYAPAELDAARGKLQRAQLLSEAGHDNEAQELAELAAIDAQVARAKTSAARSTRTLGEVEADLQALREQTGIRRIQ